MTHLSHDMHISGVKPTEISREVGGAFTLFGGHIVGRQLELEPNERIVQAWRVVRPGSGSYSTRFELVEQGRVTRLCLITLVSLWV